VAVAVVVVQPVIELAVVVELVDIEHLDMDLLHYKVLL
jgi:hypothetical protein